MCIFWFYFEYRHRSKWLNRIAHMCMVHRIHVRLYKMMYTFPSKMSSPEHLIKIHLYSIFFLKKNMPCETWRFFLYEPQNCLKKSKTDLNEICVWRLVVCFPSKNVLSWTKRYVFIMGHILECRYLNKFSRLSLEIFGLLISDDTLSVKAYNTQFWRRSFFSVRETHLGHFTVKLPICMYNILICIFNYSGYER